MRFNRLQFNRLFGAAVTVLAVATPGLVLADSKLTLVLGGEGFDGPPKFAVLFGGKAVGSGTLDAAIDTTTAGRFADASDRLKYTKTLDFDIPDTVFKPDGEVTVKLANEAHGAAGSRDDRELYLKSVSVNGTEVPASKLAMRSSLGVEPTALLGDYLVISESGVAAVAAAPQSGWPKPDVAAAAPVAEPAVKPPVPATPPTEKPAEVAKAAPVPMPPEKPAPATVQPAAADTDLAAGNPDPEGGPADCGLQKAYQITGFAENSNELTPRVQKALDVIVKEIGTQKCAVRVSGYSSTEGDFAHNALFSIERAQNALHYLGDKGVKFAKYSANGVGETTQFGPVPSANRRVVVTVGP